VSGGPTEAADDTLSVSIVARILECSTDTVRRLDRIRNAERRSNAAGGAAAGAPRAMEAAPAQGLPGALHSVSIIRRIERRRTKSVEHLGQR
jgi:hypothetical protein